MKTIHVVAGIFIRDGKVLLARRKEEKSLGGYWEFPGGKIEEGEDPAGALIREINEELGIEIAILARFMENEHDYPNFRIRLISFVVDSNQSINSSTDHDLLEWVEIDRLHEYEIAPADIPITERLIK